MTVPVRLHGGLHSGRWSGPSGATSGWSSPSAHPSHPGKSPRPRRCTSPPPWTDAPTTSAPSWPPSRARRAPSRSCGPSRTGPTSATGCSTLIDQYREKQDFVQQALNAFLKILPRLKPAVPFK